MAKNALRVLAGQTAIYGISSIAGRFLYFLLTPIYTDTDVFPKADYGVVVDLFSFMGIALVFFTYRMELAYFRYGANDEAEAKKSFDTSLSSIVISSVFLGGLLALVAPMLAGSPLFQYPEFSHLIVMAAGILALDAVCEIPYSRLRLEGRAWRFALIRFANISVNLGLNLFFLLFCPFALQSESWSFIHPFIGHVYDPVFGIGYVFLSNLVASGLAFLLLLPQFRDWKAGIDWVLWKKMMRYALPMVVVGISFVINEMLDRKIFILLAKGSPIENRQALGEYGANYKLAMILALFTQAFRYGAEPFFFRHRYAREALSSYATIAKYFLIAGLIGFLVILYYIDFIKYFIGTGAYWGGLHVVPILLLANLMLGLYYNFSVWYKLTDLTRWGAYISVGGALITIVLNVWWIPVFSYTGSAWATLICYTSMAAACYMIGRKHLPIPYELRRMLLYLAGALLFWQAGWWIDMGSLELNLVIRTGLLLLFAGLIFRLEKKKIRKIFGSKEGQD